MYPPGESCYPQRNNERHSMMTSRWYAATAFALLVGTGCMAQEVDHGLKVGQKAPAFKLKDQTGRERSLEEMLKAGQVAVVFHRSADW